MKKTAALVLALTLLLALSLTASAAGGKLSLEEAKQAALDYAQVQASDATFTKAHSDWDDGREIYEIEFYANDMEYEMDVDALTGRITDFSTEYHGYGGQPAAVPDFRGDSLGNNGGNVWSAGGRFAYCGLRTNAAVDSRAELCRALTEAAALIPGVSGDGVMTDVEDGLTMTLAGSGEPAAMITVRTSEDLSANDCGLVGAELCKAVGDLLGIAQDRIFISFEESDHWGWNGGIY